MDTFGRLVESLKLPCKPSYTGKAFGESIEDYDAVHTKKVRALKIVSDACTLDLWNKDRSVYLRMIALLKDYDNNLLRPESKSSSRGGPLAMYKDGKQIAKFVDGRWVSVSKPTSSSRTAGSAPCVSKKFAASLLSLLD